MAYRIGVDFGTTNSTISYIDNGKEPAAFRYPPVSGNEYIPSCVAYPSDGEIYIGRSALGYAADPGAIFCSNLKMVLPQPEKERHEHGWPAKKSPEAAIEAYLRQILMADGTISFKADKGKIDGVVFSVPHVWDRDMKHAGRTRLESIVSEKLNLPLIRLVSEPMAAAAYYAYVHRQKRSKPFKGNLLICDTGGGTFDVTLCRLGKGKVEELHNDGNGRQRLGRAGVCFDRQLILGGMEKAGKPADPNDPDFIEYYFKLQDFKADNQDKIPGWIQNVIDLPDLRETKQILKAGRMNFYYNDVIAAFQEIESGILEVLERVKTAMDQKGYGLDALFFVGGFSQFYPVQETIRNFWKERLGGGERKDNQETSRYAIAYGAALIANEIIQVEEKYEHTIGIEVFKVKLDEKGHRTPDGFDLLPIVTGGQKLSEYEGVTFSEQVLQAHDESPDFNIYIDPESSGRDIRKGRIPELSYIRLPDYQKHISEHFRIGMRISRSKVVYIVFKNDASGKTAEYELGDILRKMFGGFEIIEDGRSS